MIRLEFLQLRYFYESAKTESLAKTAQKYMVPASSVSAAIKRLEEELGCALFDRTANRIALNECGRRLQRSLHVIFGELEGVVEELRGGTQAREVRILVRALRAKVTEAIIRYKQQYVGARFSLTSDFEAADPSDFDVIIDAASPRYAQYESFEWCRQRILLYAAAQSPLCRRTLTLPQLADQDFVAMSPNGNQYRMLIAACEQAGFSPRILAQINDAACFFKFIASGVAIGVAGEQSVSADAGLYPLRVADFKEQQTVCVYYRREGLDAPTRRFIDFLRAGL